MTSTGALTAYSGAKTGRSPLDKRVVKEPGSDKDVWWGPVNKPMSPEVSLQLTSRASCTSRILWKLALQPRDFVTSGECSHAMGVTPSASPVHICPSAEAGSWRLPRSPLCRDVFGAAEKQNPTVAFGQKHNDATVPEFIGRSRPQIPYVVWKTEPITIS
jgi:Phosphoenolpyruvate carboxykinase